MVTPSCQCQTNCYCGQVAFICILNGWLQIRLMDQARAIIDARKQVKEAYTILQKVQKHAKQICDSFLEDLAKHLANTREITKAAAVQQILHAECQMVTFWKLGTWLKGNEYTQLTWVLVSNDFTDIAKMTWKPIVEAQELYDILTKEGQLHYYQAAETPLVNGPFAEKNGPFDDNDYCDAILHGDFDMSNLAIISEVSNIVFGMHYPNPTKPTPDFDSTLTDNDFFKAVFHTHTSSSPSG